MDLHVDLGNPEEVAAKMFELRAVYEEKLRQQAELNQQIELLGRLIGDATAISRRGVKLNSQASRQATQQPRRRRVAPAQDRAVLALEQASNALCNTAVGPTSLYKFMIKNGLEAPKSPSLLGTNLWDAWKAGRIMKASNGVYTPLDGSGKTEHDHPLTDYYFASEQGLPVPGR